MSQKEETPKDEFIRYVHELFTADDRALLQTVTGINRSVLHKYLATDTLASVNNVPQSAVSLIKLLVLVKKRSPDLYVEWATLAQVSKETFDKALPDPTVYGKIQGLGVLKYDREKLLSR